MDVFRILFIDGEYHLYYANGSKNFVRSFGKDLQKLERFRNLYKLFFDKRSLKFLLNETYSNTPTEIKSFEVVKAY